MVKCQILNVTHERVTSLCFLPKIAQIVQKVIVLVPKKAEKIGPWFWHLLIAQWLKLFLSYTFFQFQPSSGDSESSKLDQKYKFWIHPVLIKRKIFQRFLKHCFCLLTCFFWCRFQQNQTIFVGVGAQKPLKMGRADMLIRCAKICKFLT